MKSVEAESALKNELIQLYEFRTHPKLGSTLTTIIQKRESDINNFPTENDLAIEIIARFSTKTSRGTVIAKNSFIDCYHWIKSKIIT